MASANNDPEEITIENQPGAGDDADDDDLAALLTSALQDFSKQTDQQKDEKTKKQPDTQIGNGSGKKKKEKVNKKEAENVDPAMIQGVDDMFRNMMSQDPVLKEHWDKLAESCQQAGMFTLSQCYDYDMIFQHLLSDNSKHGQQRGI